MAIRFQSCLLIWLLLSHLSLIFGRSIFFSPKDSEEKKKNRKGNKILAERSPRALSSQEMEYVCMLPQSNCYSSTTSKYYSLDACCGSQASLTTEPPYCIKNESELVFIDGLFSADQTFYTCLNNVPDAGSIASFWDGYFQSCWVYYTTITLLNLVKIDEVQGLSVLQFTIDLYWYDPRFNMPLFWEYATNFQYSGIDLTALLTNQSIVMWKPLFTFPDASEFTILSESYTLYDPTSVYSIHNTTFNYEATVALTLVQPGYNFALYPNDEQTLTIRYGILNYDATQLQMYPAGIYCSQLSDGSCAFSHNPIWSWDSSQDTCTVYYDQKGFSNVWPAYTQYTISVSRAGSGLIVRLVLPITFLLLLSAVTFWLSFENRVDTTITLLLSISALYIVILQNIPMVGYLTNIDTFVFAMFVLLVLVVIAHQVYGTLREKVDLWPLRAFYLRVIETTGRVVLPPIIVGYFFLNITFTDSSYEIIGVTIITAYSIMVLLLESKMLLKVWKKALLSLIEKVNQPTVTIQEISWFERLILNYQLFKIVSTESIYLSQHIHEKGQVKVTDTRNFMELRKGVCGLVK